MRANATMWRVCDDLWDRWEDVEAQFARMARWAPWQGEGRWADADMLPLGRIGIRAERGEDRLCRLTRPEQISLLTLWLISRSPLMMGGDLPTSPPETVELLTNDEALAVQWHSTGNREVLREGDLVLWTADDTDGTTRYAAVFSLADAPRRFRVPLGSVGARPGDRVREVWSRTDTAHDGRHLTVDLPAHGAALYRLAEDTGRE
ncbi:alpha-galactosidase [Streptomyces diastatochromogenes]|uniref:alpha-galactosidase n=1 Tax=Streptomyces diastatochromogenes TaxID=42236 RepID=UPI0036A533E1